jgi:hypothetical protein
MWRWAKHRPPGGILVEAADTDTRREADVDRVPEDHRKRAAEDDVRFAVIRAPTHGAHRLRRSEDVFLQECGPRLDP